MRDLEFFAGIEHVEVPWGERRIYVPVFYYDMTSLGSYWLASSERVKGILPSRRMFPYRVSPWHCIVYIGAYEYRDSDLGPYNEVCVGIPFTMDSPTPLFTGILRKPPTPPQLYIHHLPVTTEIARAAGVELAGFPKFLADIDFRGEDDWVSCRLTADGAHILTLAGRKLKLVHSPRGRAHSYTYRDKHLLRLEFILSECEAGSSKDPSDVRLDLGDHPIAEELRGLHLGRATYYEYAPRVQAILTPGLESHLA